MVKTTCHNQHNQPTTQQTNQTKKPTTKTTKKKKLCTANHPQQQLTKKQTHTTTLTGWKGLFSGLKLTLHRWRMKRVRWDVVP